MRERAVIFDVETTGLSPRRGHRIIEIGAVVVECGVVAAEFSSLIRVPVPIPAQATRVHGITNAMLHGQPEAFEVFTVFRQFIGHDALVAHNARFDMAFLHHEFARLGWSLSNSAHCTLELSRRRLRGLPNYKLETVARYVLGVLPEDGQLHRALDDARLTARVWVGLRGR